MASLHVVVEEVPRFNDLPTIGAEFLGRLAAVCVQVQQSLDVFYIDVVGLLSLLDPQEIHDVVFDVMDVAYLLQHDALLFVDAIDIHTDAIRVFEGLDVVVGGGIAHALVIVFVLQFAEDCGPVAVLDFLRLVIFHTPLEASLVSVLYIHEPAFRVVVWGRGGDVLAASRFLDRVSRDDEIADAFDFPARYLGIELGV